MKRIAAKLPKFIKTPTKAALKRIKTVLRYPEPYGFYPALSVEEQLISLQFRGRRLSIAADYGMPLYDTIYELIDYDCYQIQKLSLAENKHVIVDIGANIGVSSVMFSQFPNSTVVCFEPFVENCSYLEANVARNQLTNVSVIQAAISKNNGTALFLSKPDANVGGYLLDDNQAEGGHLIEVPTLCLQSALESVPSGSIYLLKIDCEGGEYDIVDQMDCSLADRVVNMTFEVHD